MPVTVKEATDGWMPIWKCELGDDIFMMVAPTKEAAHTMMMRIPNIEAEWFVDGSYQGGIQDTGGKAMCFTPGYFLQSIEPEEVTE